MSENFRTEGYYQDINQQTIANAATSFKAARQLLRENPRLLPQLLKDLQREREAIPDGIAFAIVPNGSNIPLIVADSDERTTAFIPVMSCTLNAVADLSRQHAMNQIFVSDSNGKFFHQAWEKVIQNPSAVICYGRDVDASDYISLAAQSFVNETFRFTFRNSSDGS